MKYLYITCLLSFFVLAGCEEFTDDELDFSNSFNQYVELSSGSDLESEPGDAESVRVQMREVQNFDVTVSYSITGDLVSSGTVVIEAGDLNADISINVPASPTTGSATLTLTAVDNDLNLGRPNTSDPIARNITWEPASP